MIRRHIPAALAAPALVAAVLVSAPAASATCAITNYSPRSVVLGLSPVTKTFAVSASGCTLNSWYLQVDELGIAAASSAGPEVLDPYTYENFQAGVYWDVVIQGYFTGSMIDRLMPESLGFVVKRRTTWTAFNAGPEPVAQGKPITITGTLKVADWDAGKYVSQKGSSVTLQFKKAGTSTYVKLKTLTTSSTYGTVRTTVTAASDGTYRLVYGGSGTRGPATSITDYVDVR